MIGATQCFPLYYYTPSHQNDEQRQLLDATETIDGYERHDAVTDAIFEECQKRYGHFRPLNKDGSFSKIHFELRKDTIFYYVYGLLHAPAYREAFAADLKKMLARLPLVKEPAAFFAISRIGRELAELHLNYEAAPLPRIVTVEGLSDDTPPEHLCVTKMTFAKKKIFDDTGKQKTVDDKSVLHYNAHITLRNIPLDAYDYVVNGKSALEWIIERYAVTTHKDSGIVNDPNLYSPDPRYILHLFLRVITVSLKTLELVAELATIDITPGENTEQREE